MKRILITGANSYIGVSFEMYLREHFPNEYVVDTIDMIDGTWREKSFAGYDAVFHVAGIAHQKETAENAHLYYEINRDLAMAAATKAKADGVKQFIYLSSMSVYGMDSGVITPETVPHPKTNYGKSKLQAEEKLRELKDESFQLCILRPPMVYGVRCRGNFPLILRLVRKLPVFPRVKNERSLVYIDNLSSFVKMAIDMNLDGLFFPNNRTCVRTYDIAATAASIYHKKMYFSFLMGWGICILRLFVPKAKKAFGSLVYRNTEQFGYAYCVAETAESLQMSIEE